MNVSAPSRHLSLARNHLEQACRETGACRRFEIYVAANHLIQELRDTLRPGDGGIISLVDADIPGTEDIVPRLRYLMQTKGHSVPPHKVAALELTAPGEEEHWVALPLQRFALLVDVDRRVSV